MVLNTTNYLSRWVFCLWLFLEIWSRSCVLGFTRFISFVRFPASERLPLLKCMKRNPSRVCLLWAKHPSPFSLFLVDTVSNRLLGPSHPMSACFSLCWGSSSCDTPTKNDTPCAPGTTRTRTIIRKWTWHPFSVADHCTAYRLHLDPGQHPPALLSSHFSAVRQKSFFCSWYFDPKSRTSHFSSVCFSYSLPWGLAE